MIDLTKDQILTEPAKCWVRDNETLKWCPRWLVAIINNSYYTINGVDHDIKVAPLDILKYGVCVWAQCTITQMKPTRKIKKWETVEDVPPELCLIIDGKQLKYKLMEE